MDTKALKDKILQLAIQGKLVPQDENDEPASALLERIKGEKEQLIKDKVIKKEKPLPEISEDEKLFELPNGWEWCRLNDICKLITDGTHSTPKYTERGVPFISVKDLTKGFIDFSDTKFISKEEHEILKKRCNPEMGDVLLTKVGTTGIAKSVDTTREFSIFVSVALLKLFNNEISDKYIELLINSPFVRKQSEENTQGVGNKNLVIKCIKNFIIPVPPLAEQNRIVAKVDSVLKLIDELENNKQDLLQNILNSRNKVLQLAIQGKLVSQDENDEPASVLLEKIKEEKEQLIKDKVIKKEKLISDISEDEKSIELPKGWEWCRLCDITHSQTLNDGDWILSSNMDERGTVKLIQLGSIGDGKYLEKGFKTITNETFDELKCREICEGDILINRLLGKKMLACILPEIEGKKITSVDTCFIKPNKDIYNTKFILYLVLSKYFQDKVYSKVAGTTRQRISKGNLITIPFPLPPREEQDRIVSRVDAIMEYLDTLEKQMN